MTVVVFLRGVNVGGRRTFRPSILARQLTGYEVASVGAAGTFVVRKAASRAKLAADLRRLLPFETEVVICGARDLLRLEAENPFGKMRVGPEIVRFVSIFAKNGRAAAPLPITLPAEGEWLVRVFESRRRFVFGIYRRRMKTIGFLGQLDKLFGGRATTRNWNTILAVVKILKAKSEKGNSRSPSPRRSN